MVENKFLNKLFINIWAISNKINLMGLEYINMGPILFIQGNGHKVKKMGREY